MSKLPVNPLAWPEPDRRLLYLALRVLTHRLSEARFTVARHVLLVDMEIYDDPRQGVGSWLFPNEEPLLNQLGEELHTVGTSLSGGDQSQIVATATALRERIETNGVRRPQRTVC